MPQKVYHLHLKSSPERVFKWLSCKAAFPRLVPPHVKLVSFPYQGQAESGHVLDFKLCEGFFSFACRYHFLQVEPPEKLVRELEIGPLKAWRQATTITQDDDATLVQDEVSYIPPHSRFDRSVYTTKLEARIERFYHYRQQRLYNDLTVVQMYDNKPLRILVTGSSGLIGRDFCAFLAGAGHDVWQLSHNSETAEKRLHWNPDTGTLNPRQLEGFDAVYHLAGESIGAKRWSKKRKAYLLKNRKDATTLLTQALAKCRKKPKFLFIASAIGYYGNQPEQLCTEHSPVGNTFCAQLCQAIETSATAAQKAGIRTVFGRIGVVLNPQGGSLQRILPPFMFGLGGKIGSGTQHFSWIGLDDLVYALYHLLHTPSLEGAVNLTAPQHITNAEFTRELAEIINRPALVPLPAFIVRLLFGHMGHELLLQGVKVAPQKLQDSGFSFHFPTLLSALRWELGCIG